MPGESQEGEKKIEYITVDDVLDLFNIRVRSADDFNRIYSEEGAVSPIDDAGWEFSTSLKSLSNRSEVLIARKGSNLNEVVNVMLAKKLTPVVDRKLNLVIGVEPSKHASVRCALYNFYKSRESGWKVHKHLDDGADAFVEEGQGYFMSSVDRRKIVRSSDPKVRYSKQDEELFEQVEGPQKY